MGERPALGELLLRAFIARRELLVASDFQGLRVLGAGSSRDTFRIRDFLARNQVPFTWIDVDHDPQVGALLRSFGLSEADTPVVVFGSEPLLRNPTTRALADLIGVRRPLTQRVYDLVVVGGGPAGLAAAVYASSEGLATIVIDATAPGGQAGTSSKIENYLGFPTGISGADLANRAILQAQKFGAQFSSPTQVARLEFKNDKPVVWFDDDEHVSTRCLLIATGAEYRKLDVPRREQFDGLGVYYAATLTELQLCRGSEVIVVGGGNSAGQAVMFLSEQTPRVFLLLRGGDLRKNMSSYLADRIEGADNIEVLPDAEICRMLGDQWLEAVEIKNLRTGETRTVQTPAVFTFIGAIPCTNWLPAEIETDSKGFVKTGRLVSSSPYWTADREPFHLETSRPGVFAAGDVRLGSTKRVASAVGEGAMAVQFVHEYLASG
jgi:thioredoxin reductase (NADPH)